jgi:hypothetical protein
MVFVLRKISERTGQNGWRRIAGHWGIEERKAREKDNSWQETKMTDPTLFTS